MATPTATPMYRTVCKHCGVTLQTPPFTPMIGADVNPEIIQFVLKLQKHMAKSHPEQSGHVQGSIAQFTGFACVANFGIQDPILVGMQEAVRAALHRFTRRAFITDAQIEDRIAQLGFDSDAAAGLNTLMREMRDILCEEGAYAPSSSPASTPLVTP
jgi:hypothetical protein